MNIFNLKSFPLLSYVFTLHKLRFSKFQKYWEEHKYLIANTLTASKETYYMDKHKGISIPENIIVESIVTGIRHEATHTNRQ